MKAILKKWWKPAAAGAAVLILVIIVGRSCRISDKYSDLKGQYETYRAIAKQDWILLTATIEAKEKEIAGLTEKIETIIAQSGQPTPAEVEKDAAIAALEAKVKEHEAQGDLAGALDAAKAEIVQLSEKFTLSEQRHKLNVYELNAAWTAKYNAQVGISEAWKKQYENEAALNAVSQKLVGTLEGKVRILKLKNNVKTLAVIAAGGYLGYQAIRGK